MMRLFTDVLEAGFYGSIIIALVLVLRFILKKAPRWTICLLWLLAAVRLLFPFDIKSSISLQPNMTQLQQIQTEFIPDPVGQAAPAAPDNVVFPDREDIQIVIQQDAVLEEAHRSIDWGEMASYVWIAVAVGMGLYSIAAYLRLKYRVREAVKLVDNVYECAGLDTAFVLGYLWPRIYIPTGLENPKYIVDHERAHIQRGDHWFKLLMYSALAIHWFNPLVWAAYLCNCKDLEMACDERVVRDMSLDQRKAYSAALLACSASHRTFSACPVAFGEVSVKSRILGVLNYRKPRFWICLIALTAVIFVAVCFLTTPEQENKKPDQGDTISTDQETTAPERFDIFTEQEAIENSMDEVKHGIQERDALARCKTALENLQALTNCYMTGRNEFYAGSHLNSQTQVQFYQAGNDWLRIADVQQGANIRKILYLDGVLYDQISSNGPSTQTPEWKIINTHPSQENLLWPLEYVWNPSGVLVSAESENGTMRITVKVNEPVSVSGMVMDTHTLEICLDEAGGLKSIMISNMEDAADAEWNGIRMTMEVISTSPDDTYDVLEEYRQQVDNKFHPFHAQIIIPDSGQGYLDAAQAYCDAAAEKFLNAPSGTKYCYSFATCQVEAAENETAFRRQQGSIDENTHAFALTMIFVPENERAMVYSMAGNTSEYTGNDPNVPAGAYQYTLCGYITLTSDGWQGWITGTSW